MIPKPQSCRQLGKESHIVVQAKDILIAFSHSPSPKDILIEIQGQFNF